MEKSDKIATVAAVIALASMGVSLFSYLHQMESTSLATLPAVSIYERYEVPLRTEKESEKITTFKWKIENTGQGPAFIKSAFLFLPGDKRFGMDTSEAWISMESHLKEKFNVTELYAYDNDPISCPYAVKSGAEWPLFSVSFSKDLSTELEGGTGVDLAICYCSSHGECFYEGTKEKLISCPDDNVDPEELLRGNSCDA